MNNDTESKFEFIDTWEKHQGIQIFYDIYFKRAILERSEKLKLLRNAMQKRFAYWLKFSCNLPLGVFYVSMNVTQIATSKYLVYHYKVCK